VLSILRCACESQPCRDCGLPPLASIQSDRVYVHQLVVVSTDAGVDMQGISICRVKKGDLVEALVVEEVHPDGISPRRLRTSLCKLASAVIKES
jgi:hypothetical protein